ncbi:hypothetical protein BG006_001774 [Podila minutissima]|uniref:Protein kinase domain-containing protein n=1 Tax=Podila minutissima TaxID=64525 RepID=A0A9P5VGU4_9FUNG|nr:hypothetical protein BG006_001774 [Podila minutissima]
MAPLLEQLKNFIRHGKSGKDMKPRDSGASVHSTSSSKSKTREGSRNTSPSRIASPAASTVSTATTGITSQQNNTQSNKDDSIVHTNTEAASRIVAEEKQAKSKMPVYPGLERYRLVEKMGDGAFSNVYKAYDTKMDRMVAVKVVRKFELNSHQNKHLHRDMKKKPRVTERANILKEVQIMRQLKHPGIVELYEFSESNEHYFLVLELAPGGELFHRIVKLTYFSEELTRHVIVQVAQAIRYLHEEKGVIHRDIKPENILFEPIPIIPSPPGAKPDEDDKEDEGVFQAGIGGGGIGRVKIADFGLSKVVWNEHTMTPCGTVGYTAPEIVKDERYSKSVDMWAMGCVLYTLLCGFPPFYDESIQALTEKVARGQYTFLSPWWDEISAEVKDLITHLLCVNPKERYTIDQFLAHPWVKAGEKPAANIPEISIDSPATSVETKAPMVAESAPKTQYKRRLENPLSPGIGLKEVFDVSNAVHRMEEESHRRRHAPQATGLHPVDALNASTRQRQAFMSQLYEEDEDDSSSTSDGSFSSDDDDAIVARLSGVEINIGNAQEETTVKDSEDSQQAQELRLLLQKQQQDYQRAQEEIAHENHQKYLKQQQQAGHSIPAQHMSSSPSRVNQVGPSSSNSNQTISSSTSTSTVGSNSTTSTTSTTRRRRAGFELNMNQATLLNRRAKNHPTLSLGSVEQQDQSLRQDSPLAV